MNVHEDQANQEILFIKKLFEQKLHLNKFFETEKLITRESKLFFLETTLTQIKNGVHDSLTHPVLRTFVHEQFLGEELEKLILETPAFKTAWSSLASNLSLSAKAEQKLLNSRDPQIFITLGWRRNTSQEKRQELFEAAFTLNLVGEKKHDAPVQLFLRLKKQDPDMFGKLWNDDRLETLQLRERRLKLVKEAKVPVNYLPFIRQDRNLASAYLQNENIDDEFLRKQLKVSNVTSVLSRLSYPTLVMLAKEALSNAKNRALTPIELLLLKRLNYHVKELTFEETQIYFDLTRDDSAAYYTSSIEFLKECLKGEHGVKNRFNALNNPLFRDNQAALKLLRGPEREQAISKLAHFPQERFSLEVIKEILQDPSTWRKVNLEKMEPSFPLKYILLARPYYAWAYYQQTGLSEEYWEGLSSNWGGTLEEFVEMVNEVSKG